MDDQKRSDLLTYIAPFLNIERNYPVLPGTSDIDNVASFIGIDTEKLEHVRANLDESAKKAALDLLEEEDMTDFLQSLPFQDGDTLVAIGDSIIGDRQGWFEILRHLIDIGTDLDLTFINSGSYQYNSLDVLKMLDQQMMAHNPDWVFVGVGTFDAFRANYASDRTMISLTELWENLSSVQKAISAKTKNPAIWVSPAQVKTGPMDEEPLLNGTIDNTDLAQMRQVLADKKGIVVDPLGKRLGNPAETWHFLQDGVHHSVSGHLETVKSVLTAITKKSDGIDEEE